MGVFSLKKLMYTYKAVDLTSINFEITLHPNYDVQKIFFLFPNFKKNCCTQNLMK